MTLSRRIGAYALAALLALAPAIASAAGTYTNGLPTAAFPLTGNETLPLDTNLTQGLTPQTEAVTTTNLMGFGRGLAGDSGMRNVLVGGDFGVNPWQRGTGTAAFGDVSNTLTYTADQFWVLGGASSAINVSKQTGATDITAGFLASLRFQRKSANADTAAICLGQVLESKNSAKYQGQTMVLSFWGLAGANFSAANSQATVTVSTGTGSDQSAANFAAGTWTGFATAKTQTITFSTTWTRSINIAAAIPVTATQIGVKLCYTPVGTAGANDWVELTGVQLEASPAGTTGSFEFRNPQTELGLAQRFFYQLNEPAAGVVQGTGLCVSTTVCKIWVAFPTTMRAAPAAPTVTVGTYGIFVAAGTNQALASMTNTGTQDATGVVFTATASAANMVAGNATMLDGQGGTGTIKFSAEL